MKILRNARSRVYAVAAAVAMVAGIALPLALTAQAPASAATAFFWAPEGGSDFINATPHLHQLTLTSNGTPGEWETVADGTNAGKTVYLFEDISNGLCANEPGGSYGGEVIATSCVSGDQSEQFYDLDANGAGSWLINISASIVNGSDFFMTANGKGNGDVIFGAPAGNGEDAVWDHYDT